MYIKIIENNGVLINESKGVIINPNLQFGGGLKQSYPPANTPLSDTDKIIVRQGTEWKEADKSEFGGNIAIPIIANTFQQIVNGDAGIYYLSALDNSIAENPKRIGFYYKLESGFIELLNPKTLKVAWQGGIYSQKDKKQWAVFSYNKTRNYQIMNRYLQTNDIMTDPYRVPFVLPQGFHYKITDVIFDVGMRQYASVYDINVVAMKARYIDGESTKLHILNKDITTKGHSGAQWNKKDIFNWKSDDLIESIVKSNEFVTVGVAIDNTNDSKNKSLYFAGIEFNIKETINI